MAMYVNLKGSKKIAVSDNFTLYEFLYSDTAERLKLVQFQEQISLSCVDNIKLLCNYVLQPLRDYLGEPVKITSGYRSIQLNNAIKGVKNSEHLQGKAADIQTRRLKEAFDWIKDNCVFNQLIWENKQKNVWIHVSYSADNNKKEVLVYENGKYVHL
jgi:hypothetical protein